MLTLKVEEQKANIGEKEREIDHLRSELTEKEEKTAELKERLKFAEKISERGIEFLRAQMEEIRVLTTEAMERITKLYFQFEKELMKKREKK